MHMNNSSDQAIPEGHARVYGKTGRFAHLVPLGEEPSGYVIVMCRLGGRQWLGTGSQDEYDRAASLPVCGQCLKAVRGGRV